MQEKLTLLSHFLSKILNLRRNLTFLPTFLRIIRYFHRGKCKRSFKKTCRINEETSRAERGSNEIILDFSPTQKPITSLCIKHKQETHESLLLMYIGIFIVLPYTHYFLALSGTPISLPSLARCRYFHSSCRIFEPFEHLPSSPSTTISIHRFIEDEYPHTVLVGKVSELLKCIHIADRVFIDLFNDLSISLPICLLCGTNNEIVRDA